jgi:hypothetical protein
MKFLFILFFFNKINLKQEAKVGVKATYGAYPQLLMPHQLLTPLPPSGNFHYCEKLFDIFLIISIFY